MARTNNQTFIIRKIKYSEILKTCFRIQFQLNLLLKVYNLSTNPFR